ncbi:putative membrane protein YckC, RDD family [Prauserella halophila]|nr:putative membrane protein YckC, RDD family [Prauserella halophila]
MGWLAGLTVLGFLVRSVSGPALVSPSPPLGAVDAAALLLTVFPVWLYFTIGEGGRAGAGWGKRRARLRVVDAGGGRASYGRVAVRNAVKLLPWQLAHLAVARLILAVDAPVTVGVTYTLALVIPLVSIVMAWRDPLRRALHDRAAGTRVVQAPGAES